MFTLMFVERGIHRVIVLPTEPEDGMFGSDESDNSALVVFTEQETGKKNVYRIDAAMIKHPDIKAKGIKALLEEQPTLFKHSPFLSMIATYQAKSDDWLYQLDVSMEELIKALKDARGIIDRKRL